jgi:chromosome segregation ATPase
VSLIDRLPTRRPRPVRKHRADDRIADLQAQHAAEMERLQLKLGWANSLIRTQQVQIDDAEIKRDWIASRQAEAEELVVKLQADVVDLTAERDRLAEDLAALRNRFGAQLAAEANANRVDVPPMRRIGTDQDTKSVDVTSLWAAADAGLLPGCGPGRLTDSDGA